MEKLCFFFSKKYLTQKNVVEKVSTNLSHGKVFFFLCNSTEPNNFFDFNQV